MRTNGHQRFGNDTLTEPSESQRSRASNVDSRTRGPSSPSKRSAPVARRRARAFLVPPGYAASPQPGEEAGKRRPKGRRLPSEPTPEAREAGGDRKTGTSVPVLRTKRTRRRARIGPTLVRSTVMRFMLRNQYVPNPSVLVALEPSTYRDAIAASLALLRPAADVVAVDPSDLAAALVAHHPALVFLSDPAPAVEAKVPAWVLLHHSGANQAIATLGSAREAIDQPGLADLLALLDRALALVAPASGATRGGATGSNPSRPSRASGTLAQKSQEKMAPSRDGGPEPRV
jgi:hypothetical protein